MMLATEYPDPTATMMAMGVLFPAIAVVAMGALAWFIGRRHLKKINAKGLTTPALFFGTNLKSKKYYDACN